MRKRQRFPRSPVKKEIYAVGRGNRPRPTAFLPLSVHIVSDTGKTVTAGKDGTNRFFKNFE